MFKQTCGCLAIRSFVLKQKNQKFKNAGSPPGGIQPCTPGRLPCKRPFFRLIVFDASFIAYFLPRSHPKSREESSLNFIVYRQNDMHPGAERPERVRGRAISRS